MAQVAFTGGILIPSSFGVRYNPNTYMELLIDASGERVSFQFQCVEAGTIDTAEFRVVTAAINPLSVIRISLQDVSDTTGNPDGTQDQFRDIPGTAFSAGAWITPGLITSDGTDTGAKRTVAKGQWLAVVIEYQTFTALDSIGISTWASDGRLVNQLAFASTFTAGAWAKTLRQPILAVKRNDGTYPPWNNSIYPWSSVGTSAFGSGSSPDEVGMKFSLPMDSVISGMGGIVYFTANTDAAIFTLYDSDGSTVLATKSINRSVRVTDTAFYLEVVFDTEVLLLANTPYRVTVKSSATSLLTVYHATVPTAGHLGAVEGGQSWYTTERTDNGAWTDVTTKRALLTLRLASVDTVSLVGGDGGGVPWPIGHRWHRNLI